MKLHHTGPRLLTLALWAAVSSVVVPQEALDNVVIVLDASGSMAERMARTPTTKMQAAKQALKEVLRQVPETTQVGLLVFSGKNVDDDWVYPLGPRSDAELMRAVDLPQPGGGTPLGAYIKKGADRLLEQRAKQFGYGTYRLLIVTDGQANDARLVDEYTPEVLARGITVDVIGVNMQEDHTLATRVHSYRRADDPESLRRAVADVFAEVSQARTDVAQEDAFDLIAPLPVDLAASALQALSTSGNQPIGAPPPQPPPVAAPTAGVPQPVAPPPAPPASGRTIPRTIAYLVVAFVVIALLRAMGRSGRRHRR